jgi:hypothetical protein
MYILETLTERLRPLKTRKTHAVPQNLNLLHPVNNVPNSLEMNTTETNMTLLHQEITMFLVHKTPITCVLNDLLGLIEELSEI